MQVKLLYILFWQTMKEWFTEFNDDQKNSVLREFLVCTCKIIIADISNYD